MNNKQVRNIINLERFFNAESAVEVREFVVVQLNMNNKQVRNIINLERFFNAESAVEVREFVVVQLNMNNKQVRNIINLERFFNAESAVEVREFVVVQLNMNNKQVRNIINLERFFNAESAVEIATVSSSILNGDTPFDFKRRYIDAGITQSTLAFIGGGKMASALVNGFVASGVVSENDVAISVQSDASAWRWKKLGFKNVYTCNNEMLERHGAGIVFLAVKPQVRQSLFEQLNALSLARTQLLVSIMGGVDLAVLETDALSKGYNLGVVRMMPNTPASVGVGASVICSSSNVTQAKVDLVVSLAEKIGVCVQVSEKCFDAAAAVAGCGPAFVFTVIEALADGGVLGGLARSTALTLAAQTVMGAAKMVLESGEHPAKLKDDVCSPAGTTIYGMRELDRHGVRSAFIEAVYASTKRSEEL
ncbi:Putative pyrroline-5-carboxylate reductase [Toxocara canis]|uniref:pyrroline-5-carboxylate reductase n=1 Tax=Toxocara canis TaxID=6265 RepID=A0A0B2VDP6_TOXCA|nr:Putative pyrroline-5-carboxylate reductase [Toxocara canis]